MKKNLLIAILGASLIFLGACTGDGFEGSPNTSSDSTISNVVSSDEIVLSSEEVISNEISSEVESVIISSEEESIESIFSSEEELISSEDTLSSEEVSIEIESTIISSEEENSEISEATTSNKTGDIDLPFIP